MKSLSKTILFFGTEDFSLTALQALVEADYHIGAVITKPDSRSGRGQKIIAPAVKTYAQKHNIPVWQPAKLDEISNDIKAFDRPIGVLVSYGKIIPSSIISLFTPGIINVHPSLLPIYRGPTPIESAIKNRDDETGVSIMQLVARMDAGPVYHQKRLSLNGNETQSELYQKLGNIGAMELLSVLPDIINGKLTPKSQDEEQASYCPLLTKRDAFFDPSSMTANQLEAKFRAHLKFPGTKFDFGRHTIIVKKAHVADEPKTPLDKRCQDDKWFIVDEILAPSGKTTDAESFIRGYTAS